MGFFIKKSTAIDPDVTLAPAGNVVLPDVSEVETDVTFGSNESLIGTLEPAGTINGVIVSGGSPTYHSFSGNLKTITDVSIAGSDSIEGVDNLINCDTFFWASTESLSEATVDHILNAFDDNELENGTITLATMYAQPSLPDNLGDGETYIFENDPSMFKNGRPVWIDYGNGIALFWDGTKWVIADSFDSPTVEWHGLTTTTPNGLYVDQVGTTDITLSGDGDVMEWQDTGQGAMLRLIAKNWTIILP